MLLGNRRLVLPWLASSSNSVMYNTHLPSRHLHLHSLRPSPALHFLKLGSRFRLGSNFRDRAPLCPLASLRTPKPISGEEQRRKIILANRVIPAGVASTNDTTIDRNLHKKPFIDQLQRYGLFESDYECLRGLSLVGPPDAVSSLDMAKRKTRNSSSRLTKRKSTTEVTVGKDLEDPSLKDAKLTVDNEPQNPTVKDAVGKDLQHPTLKDDSGVIEDWCAYLLLSADSKKTYVGVTYDIRRRLRQHNGEIKGGAKSARAGRPWRLVCTVRGFKTRSEACQFEWQWKSTAARAKSFTQVGLEIRESHLVTRRRATLSAVLENNEEWNSLECTWHSNDLLDLKGDVPGKMDV